MKFFMVRDDDSEKAEALLAASGIRAKTFDSGYGCFAHEEAGYRATSREGAGMNTNIAGHMATKDEERAALKKVKDVIERLGEGSYLAAAFRGCIEAAEDSSGADLASVRASFFEGARHSFERLMTEYMSLHFDELCSKAKGPVDKRGPEEKDGRVPKPDATPWSMLIGALPKKAEAGRRGTWADGSRKHAIWTDGDSILCPTESQANGIADMLDAAGYVAVTGYFDPEEDDRDGTADLYTGYYYVGID